METATATTAKSLQSCPTLCDPVDGSPPGSPVPGILQARTLEWVAISSNAWKWKVKGKSLSRVWPSATPWTAAFQAPNTACQFQLLICSRAWLPNTCFKILLSWRVISEIPFIHCNFCLLCCCCCWVASFVSDSVRPYRWQSKFEPSY